MAAKRLSAVEVRFLAAHSKTVCLPNGHMHVGQAEIVACAKTLLGTQKAAI